MANSVASIKLTPTVDESHATIKVNGITLASGTESQDIALSVGGNTINVEVTAQDGITKEIYVINVTRAEPPVQQYTVTYSTNGGTGNVPVDTSSPYNAGSLVTVLDKGSILKDGCTFAGWNTKANGSGTAYAAGSQLTISEDTTLYAQWTPNPAPSNDAKLGGLNITGGNINPVFDNGNLNYTVNVANSVASIKLTPTVDESHATIKVNGITLASGTESQDIVLSVGSNTISVQVTAQDGTTEKVYTINVVREAQPTQPTQPTPVVQPVVIPVTSGSNAGISLPVTRTTANDGTLSDTAVLTSVPAASASAPVVVNDPQAHFQLTIPSSIVAAISGQGSVLTVATPLVQVVIPTTTMASLGEISLQVNPATSAQQTFAQNTISQYAIGASSISGTVSVETNYTGATTVIIPIDASKIPSDPAKLKEFISKLGVMVNRSNGENLIQRGTLIYDSKGKLTGVEIIVDHFSNFTLVELPSSVVNGKITSIPYKVNSDKDWNINFSKTINASSVNDSTVYVLDSNKNKVAATLNINGSTLTVSPVSNYKSGETYYLFIDGKVSGVNGKKLSDTLEYEFTIV